MRTSIKIERVVLDGVQLSRAERAALAPAIARELRLLAGERADEAAGRLAEPRPAGPGPSVDGIAREVAAAVHRAIGPAAMGRPTAATVAPGTPAVSAATAATAARRGPR
jgi:hypothetical protein